jgi:hypothetical protein
MTNHFVISFFVRNGVSPFKVEKENKKLRNNTNHNKQEERT